MDRRDIGLVLIAGALALGADWFLDSVRRGRTQYRFETYTAAQIIENCRTIRTLTQIAMADKGIKIDMSPCPQLGDFPIAE